MEIITNEKEIVQQLEQYGFKQDSDFHLEPVFEVTSYIEAISCVTVTKSDYENGNYDAYQNAEMENVMNHEKRKIGVRLLNSKFEPTKLEKLVENVKKLPNPKHGINQCAICGKKVVISRQGIGMDIRSINNQVRCFDHIGVENEDD